MHRRLVILPLLTGCLASDERVAPLAAFDLVTTVRDTAKITFEHQGEGLDSLDCLILGRDVEATLAGVPLTVVTRGGAVDDQCEFPVMTLTELPVQADATLTVSDATTTLDCPLGDALAPFAFEPVPAGPWQLVAGTRATIHATLPTDAMDLSAVLVTASGLRIDLPGTQTGSDLAVDIPAHAVGDFELRVLARHLYRGPVDYVGCGGVLFASHHAQTAVSIGDSL